MRKGRTREDGDGVPEASAAIPQSPAARDASVDSGLTADLPYPVGSSLSDVVARLTSGYRSVGEMVYDILKEAIVSGSFAPGERLPQEELAAAIGVSRIPVRSALIQLDAEGLVSFNPRRGAVVRSLSLAQIREIFELRKLLEVYALRKSMTSMTPERLAKIRAEAVPLDEASQHDDVVERRQKFYRLLYDADTNPQLCEIIESLRTKLGRYLLAWPAAGGFTESHVALVEVVASHDVEVASRWLIAHLDHVRATMERFLPADPGAGDTKDGKTRRRKTNLVS